MALPPLQSHDLRHPRAAAALRRRRQPRPVDHRHPTSRDRPALDTYRSIDHELIRFDDVVAEYPGFEACTPAHIEKVLAFGERVHARAPTAMSSSTATPGISRSTAAAAPS